MKPERLTEIQGIVGRSRDNTNDKPDLYWACRDLLTRNAELEAALREIADLDGGYPDDYCAIARAALDKDTP